MFEFDAGKLILIGIVALIVIGPKELPRVLRQVGQWVGSLRRMAAEFQGQFADAMREAELADIKEEAAKLAESAKLDLAFNPITELRDELTQAVDGTGKAEQPSPGTPGPPAIAQEPAIGSNTLEPSLGIDTTDEVAAGPINERSLIEPRQAEVAVPSAPAAPVSGTK